MNKKQKKMLVRILAAAALLILLNFLPVTGDSFEFPAGNGLAEIYALSDPLSDCRL